MLVSGNATQMGMSTKPVVTASVLYSSGSGITPPVVPHKPKLGAHKKGNSSVTSVTLIGESYWRSKAPKLVSLEVASQTPSIIKRGFEYMYDKSHGYRFTGGSLYFGPVSNLVRKSQRDAPPHGDSDGIPAMSISSYPRTKHDSTAAVDVYGDSTKQVLEDAPLISLREAKQREVSRRNRAAKRMLEEKTHIEHEVRQLEREVAEISRKKAQARHLEEERLARLKTESLEKEAVKTLEKQKREEGPTLTAAVAAREDGLVVAPTNWIVPLISLDEARHTEKVRRDAVDKSKPLLPLSPPPPSTVTSIDSLVVNAGGGSTATLQLISLKEAAERDRARRVEEEVVRSRTRMLAHAGTGLSHVTLIPLVEARKQDALRRKNGSSQDRDKNVSPNSVLGSRKPGHSSPSSPVNRTIEKGRGDGRTSSKDAAAPREKARWLTLMSDVGWTGLDTVSHLTRTATTTPDWV